MSKPGYIYVLINPAMKGLVKIGKTEESIGKRISELSGATGVPASFVLVCKEYFPDCAKAEKHIHTLLEVRGYRFKKNKEFFTCPVDEAVQAVIAARDHFRIADSKDMVVSADEGLDEDKRIKRDTMAEELYDKAEDSYYGHGDTIQDTEEAIELYSKAAALVMG